MAISCEVQRGRNRSVFDRKVIYPTAKAGGGPEEDTSGGFAYGGWQAPYSDDVIGAVMGRQMNLPFDLLLGRKTFEIWALFWPHHADIWPGVNTAT